ncbi:XRCC1 family protein [Megaselia abdita]
MPHAVLKGIYAVSSEDPEILITCSLMNPLESKSSSNPNRVRCFDTAALVKPIASEKWDLVKVLCTQPFNKHVQYGISFIKLKIAEEDKPKVKKPLVPEKFLSQMKPSLSDGPSKLFAGKFKLREDSPDSESDTAMGLFNRWKLKKTNPEPTTAVSIREASKKPQLIKESSTPKPKKIAPSCSSSSRRRSSEKDYDYDESEEKPKVLDRNRMDLLFGEEDDKPNEKMEKKLQKDRERREKELENRKTPGSSKRLSTSGLESKPIKKIKYDEFSSDDEKNVSKEKKKVESTPGTSKASLDRKKYDSPKPHKKTVDSPRPRKKPEVDENDNRKPITYKPFNKLLEGVTIVISGIQNPDRANLRTMALALGAKYKGDWDNSCTHLICAYKNTPKYNQVKTQGKIVKRHWVEKCHQLKKRLPWRRYALDDKEAEKPESDDEILDESFKPKRSSPERSHKARVSPKKDTTMALYDEESSNRNQNVVSSGEDTEDELERARGKTKKMDTSVVVSSDEEEKPSPKKKKSPKKNQSVLVSSDEEEKDVFEVTTDEEEFTINRRGIFSGKKIFLSSSLGAVDRMKLSNLLNEHKALICDKDSNSNIVVSTKNEKKVSVDYVTPKWVYESCDMNCLLPTKRYLV